MQETTRLCGMIKPVPDAPIKNENKEVSFIMNSLKMNNDKVYWILLAVLGLLMIIFHRVAANVIPVIAGVGLIVIGAIGLLGWWTMRSDRSANVIGQFIGALLMVFFGIWALSHPNTFSRLINIAAAVILIWSCVQNLMVNRQLLRDKVIAVVCIGGVVLGVVILLGGLNILSTGMVIAGCGLLYAACVGLLKNA